MFLMRFFSDLDVKVNSASNESDPNSIGRRGDSFFPFKLILFQPFLVFCVVVF